MPTAHEVATELRKLADALDREPEANIHRDVFVCFSFEYMEAEQARDAFNAVARLMPRPIKKERTEKEVLRLVYENDAMNVWATVRQSAICRVVTPAVPAVYECLPLLSADEEAQLTEAQ